MEDIRECVQLYGSVYVFEVENMRNVKLKQLREEWGGSRFFLGKNRVMAHALGRDQQDEPREGSSKLTPVRGESSTTAPHHAATAQRRPAATPTRTATGAHVPAQSQVVPVAGRLRSVTWRVLLPRSLSQASAVCCSRTPARRTC